MARISGIDLPRNKRIEIGLTHIYGIGLAYSQDILSQAGLSGDIRCKDLNDEQLRVLRKIIDEEYQVEGDLRRLRTSNVKRLMNIGSYRGRRHSLKLPLRGQRTRTNARTCRGIKKTVAGKKK